MFFLFPLIGAAVGAVAGAYVAHAGGEKDRQLARQHREVANKLTVDYSNLHKKYNDLENTTRKEAKEQPNLYQQYIENLTRINARNEEEKDLLRLAIRLQQSLHNLMLDIDEKPTKEALLEFKQAVLATNKVLFQLKEELFEVPITYFSRNSERAEEIEGKYTGQVIQGNIYPIEKCQSCGTQNRIYHHKSNLDPICGKCKHQLIEEITTANIRQQDRESMQIPDRDFSGTFATYEAYLNWFYKSFPAMDPPDQQQFYQSVKYYGSRNTENKMYRNNQSSKYHHKQTIEIKRSRNDRSVQYPSTQSTYNNRYRNNRKSSNDESYLY